MDAGIEMFVASSLQRDGNIRILPTKFAKTRNYLSGIKNLAKQTMWYGLSSIAARLINYLLTPFLTYAAVIQPADYGRMSLIYAAFPILNVLFTYGLETTYFRFSDKDHDAGTVYDTAFLSMLVSTLFLGGILWFNQSWLNSVTGFSTVPQLIQLSILILISDTITSIPFAKLRQDGRPVKYASIRILSILVNVFLTWFFIGYCPSAVQDNPNHWVSAFFNSGLNPIVYVLFANLMQSLCTLVLLLPEMLSCRGRFNSGLWRQMMIYALPLLVAGMGGMINETFDRLMLRWWLPGTDAFRDEQVGIYNACYKLSLLITLFIQAFRLGAEPFFFRQAAGKKPQKTYARVMKFFVIVLTIMFLFVSMFMPVWKYFIGPLYWAGLSVVPVLLLANMFLGIYYNLSIWYKLTNKTTVGTIITFAGVLITVLINFTLIPKFGFVACAWATFFCYGLMMVLSYVWGKKYYPVPYATKKLVSYMVLVVIIYGIHYALSWLFTATWFTLSLAVVLLLIYLRFVGKIEQRELPGLPVIGRFFRKAHVEP